MRKLGPVVTAAAWGLVAAGGLAACFALLAGQYRSEARREREVAAAERREKDARLAEISRELMAAGRSLQERDERRVRDLVAQEARELVIATLRCAGTAGHADTRAELVRIATEYPESSYPWAVLGRFDLAAGRPGLARDSLARAVAIYPGDSASRVLLYVAARDDGETAQAQAVASWFMDSATFADVLSGESLVFPEKAAFGRGLALLAPLPWDPPETGERAAVAAAAFRAAMTAESDAAASRYPCGVPWPPLLPANPWPRFFLGRLALGEGNPAGAAALFEEAAGGLPEEALVHYWRARAAFALGDDLAALVASSIALDRFPLHLGALEIRARVLMRLGRTSDAHRDLALALDLAPGHADLLLARGEVRTRLGRMDEAEADFLATLEKEPRSAPAFLALGRIHAARGEIELASRELERAAELDSSLAVARLERAALLLSLGRKDEALKELDLVLAAAPDDTEALAARGRILLDLGRASEAAADYERALRLGAWGWRIDEGMGDALAASGRPTAAVLYWRRAAEASPEAERIREKIRQAAKEE
ncbi:MAG: tetratricopeptide repeat protein [Planctomycetes bacterium]|nr:tetratricopeptide repeat protein [Planctomycetota bacterium]